MRAIPLLKETLRSGTIASLVMMPFGLLFQYFGLRVGHYGPQLAALLFGHTSISIQFTQHLVLGWLSALPLLLILLRLHRYSAPVTIGALYGVAYYVLINSLALPFCFGDPTPWQLGFSYIFPSLTIHLVFGASIGFTARKYVAREAVHN
jgi:uncharacterized membrane protein YagU involved in acid resistance